MKSFFIILIPIILICCCPGCGEDEKNSDAKGIEIETYENQDVLAEQFIKSLKDSTFTAFNIPYFNPEAITVLLRYADDFSPIYYFPASLLSSFYFEPKKLGECMIWTIESIRVKHPLTDENQYFQFVSSQPLLLKKTFLTEMKPGIDVLKYRPDNQQLHAVYEAYKKWWGNYNHENFKEIRKTNPLEGLEYIWY